MYMLFALGFVLYALGLGWRNHGGRKTHVHPRFHRHEIQRRVRIRLVAGWIFCSHCMRSLNVSYSSYALGFSIKASAHSIGLFNNFQNEITITIIRYLKLTNSLTM